MSISFDTPNWILNLALEAISQCQSVSRSLIGQLTQLHHEKFNQCTIWTNERNFDRSSQWIDGWTDGWRDRQTDRHSGLWRCEDASKKNRGTKRGVGQASK